MTAATTPSSRPAPLPPGAPPGLPTLDLVDPTELGRYAADLKRRALALTRGDSSRAADLVQDTFERALANLHRLLPQSNLRAWLYTIMVRLYRDWLRQDRVRRSAPYEDELAPPVEEAGDPPRWCAVSTAEVRAALNQLAPEQREVFERREFGGQSYQRIAADLGIAVPTVGSRLWRAREQLRDLLKGRLEAGGDE